MCKRSQTGTVVTTFIAMCWLGGEEATLVSGEALRMQRQAFSVLFKITHRDRIYKYTLSRLTLRRLMSYIYMEHPFLMFLDHTQRRSTVGRTPLDE